MDKMVQALYGCFLNGYTLCRICGAWEMTDGNSNPGHISFWWGELNFFNKYGIK